MNNTSNKPASQQSNKNINASKTMNSQSLGQQEKSEVAKTNQRSQPTNEDEEYSHDPEFKSESATTPMKTKSTPREI